MLDKRQRKQLMICCFDLNFRPVAGKSGTPRGGPQKERPGRESESDRGSAAVNLPVSACTRGEHKMEGVVSVPLRPGTPRRGRSRLRGPPARPRPGGGSGGPPANPHLSDRVRFSVLKTLILSGGFGKLWFEKRDNQNAVLHGRTWLILLRTRRKGKTCNMMPHTVFFK